MTSDIRLTLSCIRAKEGGRKGVAHNQSRPGASLLMSRLRVESNGNEVAFLRNIGCHLPNLSADGFSPVNFPGLVILWDA